jgi:hypothetical protein
LDGAGKHAGNGGRGRGRDRKEAGGEDGSALPPVEDERLLRALARVGVIVITDADYRCVWRPCPALEDDVPAR